MPTGDRSGARLVNGHSDALGAKRPQAPGGAAVGRGLMKEQAYEEIKRAILYDDFPPGTFLSERQLAERLRMSKTPVKAALERLELEGFITVSPQQGIVVRNLTIDEIADIYETRVVLESYTLRAIAGRLNAEQERKLRANLEAQESLLGTGRIHEGMALDTAFHMLFVEFLNNQEIERVMRQLREKMQRVILKVFQLTPARLDSSYEEHIAIAEAALAGKGDKAAALIEDHLERGKRLILSPRRA
jgi:DNA-binding GntR family transcriptional regulator